MMTSPPPQQTPTHTAPTTAYTAASWREFFDTTTLSFPISFSEAWTRLDKNLPHYRVNYGLLGLMILPLLIFLHHLTVNTFLLAVAFLAAFYHYFSARLTGSPIQVFGSTIEDQTVSRCLFFVGLCCILLLPSGYTALRFLLAYAVVVFLHGAFKVPRTEDRDEKDPNRRLLDHDASGATYNTM